MSQPPNVVLIVLDTVRRDRVSAYGYDRETTPAFDAFAEGATLFSDAVSQSSWSIPSHASLLTGEYPSDHGATTVRPVLRTNESLPVRLRHGGYETYAFSPNVYVRPATGFGTGFDEFHSGRVEPPEWCVSRLAPILNRTTSAPRMRRPMERLFNRWLLRGRATGTVPPRTHGVAEAVESVLETATEPVFLFVNLPHAHLPRSPAPRHRDRFVDEHLPVDAVVTNERSHNLGKYTMDNDAMRAMSDLYDADLRTLDDHFQDVLDALDRSGVRDNALVIVTADHGEHLGERGLVGHQHSVFDPVVRVPLAIDVPDGGPDTVESQVETRRIYHTALEVAGVESHPERTLASGVADETAQGSFHSPMLDMFALLREGRIEYDRRLLGEPLRFERTREQKLVSFDDEEWEPPETVHGQPSHDCGFVRDTTE